MNAYLKWYHTQASKGLQEGYGRFLDVAVIVGVDRGLLAFELNDRVPEIVLAQGGAGICRL